MKSLFLSFLFLICFSMAGKAQYNNDLVIEPILKTDTTSIGQKIKFPCSDQDEVTMLKITLAPGKATGWHIHEIPVFAYVLKGTLTVEFENHRLVKFPANSSFAEVTNTLHQGINNETEELVLLAVYLGVKGKPLSIKKEKPL